MIDLFIPVITVSESNLSQHWTKKAKLHTMQRWTTFCAMQNHSPIWLVNLPCKILMIRRGMRKMDFDNLVASLKHIRDSIADYLIPGLAKGQADGDHLLSFQYGQLPTKKEKGVWVIIYE